MQFLQYFLCIYFFIRRRDWCLRKMVINIDLLTYLYIFTFSLYTNIWENHIGGVMVSVLASNAVDRGFEPRSGQTKDYKIQWYLLLLRHHAALRRKSKDWLARNQDNVSEWSDMSTRGLLFQWASTMKIQLSMLV